MAQTIEESLLQTIKKDDIKAFDALMENAQCGAYRLGRFPVLSLLYLYKSRKLIAAYEERFIKITSYVALREPAEISKKFSGKAGKCLRLYLDETVSPLEMLLILDKTRRLKRVFPMTRPSAAIKERLKTVYSIKYALGVSFEGDGVIIDRRPLSYREKKTVAVICLCSVLAVSVTVAVPVTVDAFTVDLASAKAYTLKHDLIVTKPVEKVNCTIIGNGHKLIFKNGAAFGELNGKLSNLTIETAGDPIATTVSETAAIENLTVNVVADITSSEGVALVAQTNYGTIDGVTVNISGKISAVAASEEVSSELTFGGLALENGYKSSTAYGIIKNCTVNYSDFSLIGEAGANAAFGGIAGKNDGYVQDCAVTGAIVSDTFDIAGVCSVNNGMLLRDINAASLSQTSADTDWNPVVSGIVLTNAYGVEACENKGDISAVSTCPQFEVQEGFEPTVSAAGIAYINRGVSSVSYNIINCVNSGSVGCRAENRNAYAAGVCLSSGGGISGCNNSGAITVAAENGNGTYAGGITTIANADINKSVNEGAITATGSGVAYVGGISAHALAQFVNCFSGGDITATAQRVYAGGIFGFSDVASNGYYIYWGVADRCISDCKITVEASGDDPSCVGGIAGFIRQARLEGDEPTYFGGRVISCYFTGELISEITYFGNLIGVCGANVYENNSYTSGTTQYPNFEGNFYIDNSSGAFGATLSNDGNYALAEDKGATCASLEEIQNSEAYKSILSELGK